MYDDNYFPTKASPTSGFSVDEAATTNQTCKMNCPTGTAQGKKMTRATVWVQCDTLTAGQVTFLIQTVPAAGMQPVTLAQKTVTVANVGHLIQLDEQPILSQIWVKATISGGGGAATATGQAYFNGDNGPAFTENTDWA